VHSFVKFPSTPHLAVLDGGAVRSDKVLSPGVLELFLTHEVTVEEKLYSANLGISFDSEGIIHAQNLSITHRIAKLAVAGKTTLSM